MRMIYDFLPEFAEGDPPPKTIDRRSLQFGGQLRGLQRKGKRPCMIAIEEEDIRSIIQSLSGSNPAELERLRYYFITMMRTLAPK